MDGLLDLGDTVLIMLWQQFQGLVKDIVKKIVILEVCIALEEKAANDIRAVYYYELCDVVLVCLILQIVAHNLKYIAQA